MLRFAFELHAALVREGQVGPVPGAALALTVAALAVVHHHRFARDFITDRAAGASTGISLAHVFSPTSVLLRAWDDPGSEKGQPLELAVTACRALVQLSRRDLFPSNG